jgi:hypothetical protein
MSVFDYVPAGLPWVGMFVTLGASAAAIIKAYAVLRKVQLDAGTERHRVELDAGGSMRGDLLGRIDALEKRVRELERELAAKDSQHNAEMAISRHSLANEKASLDAFLLLAKNNPDRLQDIVPQIMEMREAGRLAIAAERGAMAGARIAKP